MRTSRLTLTATLLAVGLSALPAAQASAATGASGPSIPFGTPLFQKSQLGLSADTGVIVGDVDSRVVLWKDGQTKVLTGVGGQANGINASGSFTGSTFVGTGDYAQSRAIVWDGEGTPTDITPAGASRAIGRAIADDGTVLLTYNVGAGPSQYGVLRGGALTPLPLGEKGRAVAMNNSGETIAVTYPGWVATATKCTAAGVCAALPTPSGTLRSEVTAINDSGDAVGWAEVQTSPSTRDILALLWSDNGATVLPALAGETGATATRISDAGLVGGRSGGTAVVWRDGAAVELAPGTPHATYELGISGINSAGEVVGTVVDTRDGTRKSNGFLWKDGRLTILDGAFPLPFSGVSGITEGGLILGVSFASKFNPLYPEIYLATTWRAKR
ncbi:hypothetical protein L6E12_04790 [Actinokineospora sp. PR83]|uniref:hypothetical protein n=1 Tax=Actinokineospora sp. PR83 TaxID=2884908 RepID=UPI001F2DCAA5|nr:hypothetical protein [Actinokineospora sp. PR83]MCG8915106.1 hypothetical protein [Actinokineospora sp. PR83]